MDGKTRIVTVAACALLAVLAAVSVALAQIPEASYLTVDQPLDVGGTVLEPGVYVIKVLPNIRNRNILQITNEEGTKIFATVLSVPHPLAATEEMKSTKYVFYPASGEMPRALRTWYAPDSTSGGGHDIVYPERRAMQIAAATNEPVIAYKGEQRTSAFDEAQLETVTPDRKIAEFVDRDSPGQVAELRHSEAGRELPRTAGNGGLLLLGGLFALGGAIAVRAAATRA